ncbi:MAG: hypothetical protein KJ914_06805 [Gammaproteobacteria bacterium]|nr:hypothetical protein [Gammaproteobacteria bacterium]MBU1725181.1 hypothetical protein [Gammaproteobacteria bacterium]MBU2005125.1 hypothetical protein [Gammaproteobacteria bacterium]
MTDYQGQTQDVQTLAAGYRAGSGDFSHWAKGYGVITHSDATQVNIHRLADHLYQQRTVSERDDVFCLPGDLFENQGSPL